MGSNSRHRATSTAASVVGSWPGLIHQGMKSKWALPVKLLGLLIGVLLCLVVASVLAAVLWLVIQIVTGQTDLGFIWLEQAGHAGSRWLNGIAEGSPG